MTTAEMTAEQFSDWFHPWFREQYEPRQDSRQGDHYMACKRCGMAVYAATKHARNVHGDDVPSWPNGKEHLSDEQGRYIGGNAERLARLVSRLREIADEHDPEPLRTDKGTPTS